MDADEPPGDSMASTSAIEGFRVSPQQARLWSLLQAQASSAYHASGVILIEGEVEVAALQAALNDVLTRSEILRTTFRRLPGMGRPLQVITPAPAVVTRELDLSAADPARQEAELETLRNELIRSPFDLEQGPLIHLALARLSPQRRVLLVGMSALCSDSRSLEILTRDLSRFYAARVAGSELPDEPLQYADCAEWLNQLLESNEAPMVEGDAFWSGHNLELLSVSRLPTARQPTPEAGFHLGRFSLGLSTDLSRLVSTASTDSGSSVPLFLFACWQVLLSRLSGQRELAMGWVHHGRGQEELQSTLGPFAKHLPIPCDLPGHLPFRELIGRVEESVRTADLWQDAFSWQGLTQASGNGSRAEYIPVCFEFEQPINSEPAAGVSFALSDYQACLDRFELKLRALLRPNGLTAEFHYDTTRFSPVEIDSLSERLRTLLADAAQRPDATLAELEILGPAERHRLAEFNQTREAPPELGLVHRVIEHHAARTPGRIAVDCDGRQLSYGELNSRANQLSAYLRGCGVGPEVLVGLYLTRSPDVAVAILGVVKAGGAWLALDPGYPPDRLEFLLNDARPSLIISQEKLPPELALGDARVVILERAWPEISLCSAENPAEDPDPSNLAYLVYTSGSTGVPKGVMVTHGSVGQYVQTMGSRLELATDDVYLHTASFAFSSSVRQLLLPLAQGAGVVIATSEQVRDPVKLFQVVRSQGVTTMDLVPSYWRACANTLGELPPELRQILLDNQLRRILSASEPLPGDLPVKWTIELGHPAELVNMFGLTETTGIAALQRIEVSRNAKASSVPVGRPIGNTRIHLLDSKLRPVPIGVIGEIYVSGPGVSRGYLNQAALTAEAFVPDPFPDQPGARMCRTGDLGRYLPDGIIEVVGRLDHQTKIRGIRVEPAEIESVLQDCPGVRAAVVVSQEAAPGERRLLAYVVPGTPSLTGGELQQRLKERLPPYMIPSAFVLLDALPLTSTGKIDRLALRKPDYVVPVRPGPSGTPRTDTEKALVRIWAEVLGLKEVGIHDDLFELGSHSLIVTQAVSRIRQALAFDLSVETVFDSPTVAQLGAIIDASAGRPAAEGAGTKPGSGLEAEIAAIWGRVLGLEQVDVHADFFELGGDSLRAIQLISQIRAELQVDLPVRSLFDSPTVAGLAAEMLRWQEKADQSLTERLATLSAEQRKLLEARLGEGGLGLEEVERIPRRTPAPTAPLSFAQHRLWFIEQLEPGTHTYSIGNAIRLKGPLQLEALSASLQQIIRRHEVLRTVFAAPEGDPIQVIAPTLDISMRVTDLSELPRAEREAEARRLVVEQFRNPFDLTEGPLLRASLLRVGSEDHVLMVSLHHIICDGWSMGVLFRELGVLYDSFVRGEPAALPDLPIQYADYAVWQRQWIEGEVLDRELAYWRSRLEGAPASLSLPTDHPRPAIQSYRGAKDSIVLPSRLAAQLHALAQREGVTLFMTLLAAFQALLARYSGQRDIVVGSPVAGRDRAETEGLIGLFLNTLAFRTDLSGDPTFRELLSRVREVALGAYAHQDLPFEKLVEELRPERSMAHSPLFQVMFVLQNTPRSGVSMSGLTLEPFGLEGGVAKYDLTLVAREATGGLRLRLEYNTDLFQAATITRMLGHFRTLLESCTSNPDRRLSELPLLTDAERYRQLVEWNATELDEDPTPVQVLFEEQAALTPDAVAVVGDGEELTYEELDQQANQLARYLRGCGVGPEVRVGVCLERSPKLLVALLGILKAGGAYLPLDPGYPVARLGFMLSDSRAPVLLTQLQVQKKLPAFDGKLVYLDVEADRISREDTSRIDPGVTAENLAYVIYTSGSTGRPKGVQVPHRAVVNFLHSMQRVPGITGQDTLLAVTTLAFDIAGLELLLPLTVGARVVIAPSQVAKDGRRLAEELSRSSATIMQATPAGWHLLVESGWPGSPDLRAFCGGEALPSTLADQLLARCSSLWNLYGPTETTIWSAVARVSSGASRSVGRPIANTRLYLLDRRLQPVPIGVAGELFIAGSGLARGYLNQPGLTAERFLPDPFSSEPGSRMYRTGDLMHYRPDGSLVFLGRTDHQIKLRGFRIELGEIESVLLQHPSISQAIALVREDAPGDRRLIAWVVPAPGKSPTIGELRSYLQRELPEHMLPSAIVFMDAVPLTPAGKLDRAALPAADWNQAALARSYVAPRNSTEQALADIWAKLLRVEKVGVHDNFFELGGHSLLATLMMARVQAAIRVELPLRALFEDPTIESIARRIEAIHQMVLEISQMEPGELQARVSATSSTEVIGLVQELEQMTEHEVERLLAAELRSGPNE